MSTSKKRAVLALAPIVLLAITAEVNAQANDVVCDNCVDTSDIAFQAVTTTKLKTKAVTAGKIGPGAVTTYKIKKNAVTFNKLSPDVADAINGSIGGLIFQQFFATDGSGVASRLCPTGTLVGSASCTCDGDGQSSNFGVLFGCTVAGNGGVAACYPDSFLYDPFLPMSPATITLTCVSAVQNDGTPITPTPLSLDSLGFSKVTNNGVDLETAVNNARSTVSTHWSILQSR